MNAAGDTQVRAGERGQSVGSPRIRVAPEFAADVLVVGVESAPERLEIGRATLATDSARFFSSVRRMLGVFGPCPPQGIVLGCDSQLHDELALLAEIYEKYNYPTPVLIWSGLSNRAVSAIGEHHALFCDVRLGLRGFDSLPRLVRSLFAASGPPLPRAEIIVRAHGIVTEPALSFIARAAILGERCNSVTALARICGTSVRTLEAQLARHSPLPAKSLLMWMLALHTAWRVERLNWTGKKAAIVAGLNSERLLSNRIERATGLRTTDLGRAISFAQLLDRFGAALRREPANANSANTHSLRVS